MARRSGGAGSILAERWVSLLARIHQAPARALYKYSARSLFGRVRTARKEKSNEALPFGDCQHQAECGPLPFRHCGHHHSPELTSKPSAQAGGFLLSAHDPVRAAASMIRTSRTALQDFFHAIACGLFTYTQMRVL